MSHRGVGLFRTVCFAGVLANAVTCASPQVEAGSQFIGVYDATEEIVITSRPMTGMGGAMTNTIRNTMPITIRHGVFSDLVINDGQCLISADAMGADHLTFHPDAHCTRPGMGPGGPSLVLLTIMSGTGAITPSSDSRGRNLTITASGPFTFITDGGMAMGGDFMLTISGGRL